MSEVTSETMIEGRYYEVKYPANTYLCQALSRSRVHVRWIIRHDTGEKHFRETLNGRVDRCDSIREISYQHYIQGMEHIKNNLEAKKFLQEEYE